VRSFIKCIKFPVLKAFGRGMYVLRMCTSYKCFIPESAASSASPTVGVGLKMAST
jgi:hypothetical protein